MAKGHQRHTGGRHGALAVARFSRDPSSVADARRFVGTFLGARPGVPLVKLLVSELATNAVLHGEGPFEVRIVSGSGGVRVEVRDSGLSLPRRARVDADAESGRGLQVVDGLAAAWGVTRLETGKAVWFEV